MTEAKDKILVALDGEEKSFKTIQYLCAFKPFRDRHLVLFNVMNKVPEYYYDLGTQDFSQNVISRGHAWEYSCRKQMDEFMNQARTKLLAQGFSANHVDLVICERNRGIARDILDEAQKGYHALVLRRRGIAKSVLPVAMGSVSSKLIEKATDVPLILAGILKVSHSLFWAIDGSKGADRAVEFVADTLKGSDCRFVLGSVIRDFYGPSAERLVDESGIWTSPGLEMIEKALSKASDILLNAGFNQAQIAKRTMKGAKSRSGAIVEMAMEEGCDTIVFGRKGKSRVSDFNIGRVPWKVVNGARKMTVWMVP
ncbi:MAG: universal stress protein [Desulfobacter sp.]|nr:universal stress protein [Desulfobacter sp.]WDP84501.1 MAG: universal stress protein [Desulfobacter sp.]